jgi:hypothetical protein
MESGTARGASEAGRAESLSETDRLFLHTVRELFDDGVGEDFAGNPLDLRSGGVSGEPIGKGKSEILALADGCDLCESDLAQSVLNGLPLRVKD